MSVRLASDIPVVNHQKIRTWLRLKLMSVRFDLCSLEPSENQTLARILLMSEKFIQINRCVKPIETQIFAQVVADVCKVRSTWNHQKIRPSLGYYVLKV